MACCRTISPWKNRYDVWSVITTEAHLAFAAARVHSNNTAEMSGMVEALSFRPMARLPVMCTLDAGVCLGTIQARTHVQLALSCQQSLLKVQHRLRFTMQHVYDHAENLRNECADHAAALGAFGLVSNHNPFHALDASLFDSASCFATCYNLGDVLEKYVTLGRSMFLPSSTKLGDSALFHTVLQCVPFSFPLPVVGGV